MAMTGSDTALVLVGQRHIKEDPRLALLATVGVAALLLLGLAMAADLLLRFRSRR
jgi:hypothetical protein